MKQIMIFLSCLISLGAAAQPGYISVIAGTGGYGFSGDGGPATAAQLSQVEGVFPSRSGAIYIVDYRNQRIRKIDVSGTISTFAGGDTSLADGILATNALMDDLHAVNAFLEDRYGNICFVDGNRVRKVDISTGIITTLAGSTSGGYSGDGGAATAAELNWPRGLCYDAIGNIYIGDDQNHVIRKIDTSGIITTFAGTGTSGFGGDGGPATAAQFHSPDGLCFDAWGNLYIADRYNYRIRKIDPSGTVSTFAGTGSRGYSGDGGPATAAEFFEVSSVCADAANNIYIADFHNTVVRIVDGFGIVNTFAGGGSSTSGGIPATSANFSDVWGIAIDTANNIYIADRGSRVWMVNAIVSSAGAADSFSVSVRSSCAGPKIAALTRRYAAGMTLITSYGDGTTDTNAVAAGYAGRGGYAILQHSYASSGTYNIQMVLYNGTTPIDTITQTYVHRFCNEIRVRTYVDNNSNCTYDTAERSLFSSFTATVDSNGVTIDTVIGTSGFNYTAWGAPGSVYSFRVLRAPTSLYTACPSTGVFRDTVSATVFNRTADLGFRCSSTVVNDFQVYAVIPVTGIRDQWGNIYVQDNASGCGTVPVSVTANYSSKYGGSTSISPTPSSSRVGEIIWNLSSVGTTDGRPVDLYWAAFTAGSTLLTIRDTVHAHFRVTSSVADADSSNNYDFQVDTVRAGYDPNAIYVKPGGCLSSGAVANQLQYTITFENMGNDTAHNIYVLDTLSEYLDPSSVNILMNSHKMYTSHYRIGSRTVFKFDFPNIKLLDSSYKGFCDGAVVYTINTKAGLPIGTNIMNRAGIYFDINEVVMTNEVHTPIGCPITQVGTISNPAPVHIYPNPAGDVLHIDITDGSYESCTITNSVGVVVGTHSLAPRRNTININTLTTGIYYITLRGAGGAHVAKLLKE